MNTITHKEQRERWNKEHQRPTVLLQMDSTDVSSGVEKFFKWLKQNTASTSSMKGTEICCGKGRNVIWLAKQGIEMVGVDFSVAAISEAKKRAQNSDVANKTIFFAGDVTKPLPVIKESQDFAIDCFGSTDIESRQGREQALTSIVSALKPGGYLMVYLLSTDDEFHAEMIAKSPGPDAGSFIHPINGKYEKAFTEDEVKEFYGGLKLMTLERVPKKAVFFDKEYNCNHIWAIFQKPN